MASNEYTNAFNRYQTNRTNQIAPLQSLANQGQSSANFVGQAGQNYANNAGEAMIGAGNARASGYMGTANAVSGGLGQYLNYQQNQNYLNALRASAGGGYGAQGNYNWNPGSGTLSEFGG